MSTSGTMELIKLSAVSAGLGILAHVGYFIRGEHHTKAPRLFKLFLITPVVLFLVQLRVASFDPIDAFKSTVAVMVSFLIGLYLSMAVYRVFFHRLRSFPGPFWFKVSKLYHITQITDFYNYKTLHKLQKYGDFVRTGPSELSIFAPEAIPALYGASSKCTKGPRYDVSLPTVSMHSTRDRALHDRRRRVWDRAFNIKSLRNYEGRVIGYANQLVRQISAFSGKPILANQWLNFFSFDVMGDLAFGRPFDMLKEGKKHYILDKLVKGQTPLGVLQQTPWLFMILVRLSWTGVGTMFGDFVRWCGQQVEERKKLKVEEPDIMSHLLEASLDTEDPTSGSNWLLGDSRLIVVAGSDTTAATLTHIFYHLAQDQAQLHKLRDELEGLDISKTDFTYDNSVRNAEHLNAVINETLRMHHPIPGGMFRLTPPEGITIAGTYIPGDTIMTAPLYSIGRSPKAYERPDEFIPERWYSQPELIKNKDAFAPFINGVYSCIGKQLAMMSMRTVVALLVLNFDVTFAPGEDGSALLNDTRDLFTMSMANIRLVFQKRA